MREPFVATGETLPRAVRAIARADALRRLAARGILSLVALAAAALLGTMVGGNAETPNGRARTERQADAAVRPIELARSADGSRLPGPIGDHARAPTSVDPAAGGGAFGSAR